MSPLFKKYGKARPSVLTNNQRRRRDRALRNTLAHQAAVMGLVRMKDIRNAMGVPRGRKAMAVAAVALETVEAIWLAQQFGRVKPLIKTVRVIQ